MTISKPTGALKNVSGEVLIADIATGDVLPLEIETTPWTKAYLSADDYPALAAIWDNDDDAIFDDM
jgi:hypothetical protein